LAREENRRTILSAEVVLAFRLLTFTGARLREILTLQWSHIDLERGLINLPDSKTGRKTIVMSAATVDLLREHERPGSNGDKPRSDLKKPWRAIQRHAKLEGVRIHDLRHTFASIGAGASLGLPIVGKLLGHSQPATTARYAHLDAAPLRRASNVIGDHLAAALWGSQSYADILTSSRGKPIQRGRGLRRRPGGLRTSIISNRKASTISV
jgi:integrase